MSVMLTSREIYDIVAASEYKPGTEEFQVVARLVNRLAWAIKAKDIFFNIENFVTTLGYPLISERSF